MPGRLQSLLAQFGYLNGSLYVVDRVLEKLSAGRARVYKYYFVAQPVPDAALLAADPRASIQFRQLGEDEAKALGRPSEVIEDRLLQGAICIAGFKNAELAGFIWLLCGSYREDEVRCRFTPRPAAHAAWDFDVYILPRFRLGRFFVRLWEQANDYLRARSIRWTISRISAFNSGSVSTHAKLGAMMLGWAVFLKCGPCQLMLTNLKPFVHVSFNAHSVPEILLFAPTPPHGGNK